jgi:chorismate dehydratase
MYLISVRDNKQDVMLKLGHIIYSNCFPVHAGILTGKIASPFTIVEGIPTELNRALVDGKIDVSPSSSIEYATYPGKYRILPGLSITSRNKVMSILLESRVPLDQLNNRTVALTTASATSVVLLRIILELFNSVSPDFMLYEQPSSVPSAPVSPMPMTLASSGTKRPACPSCSRYGR